MASRTSSDHLLVDAEINTSPGENEPLINDVDSDADAIFGGPDKRKDVERALLRKLDLRLTFLLLISVMNYVGLFSLLAYWGH